MARENELDRRVKEDMIRDTVRLVAPLPYDRDALVTTLERRMGGTQGSGGSNSSSGHYEYIL